jgi:pimeloyl-ACP methyl ester carboxylesterase
MAITSRTIVFIHGLFQNSKAWDRWIGHFEKLGYACHAPAYPHHDGEPATLRKQFNPALGRVTLSDVLDKLRAFIDTLSEKPILIGHSMSGLIVQLLLASGKGAAGVAIHSAPPKGIVALSWNFLKSNLPVINPLKGNTVFEPTVDWFHYAFCHTATPEETQHLFEATVVPESRNIPRSSTGDAGKIDFSRPHPPLLFIAGEEDNIVPAKINMKNYKAYKDKNSRRVLKVFPGRTHSTCTQQGWEKVAGYIENWLKEK